MKRFGVLVALWVAAGPLGAAPPARVPILFDSDIGSGIDDAFALALILGSDELDLRGVTTVSGNTQQRAMMLCRFLTMTGRRHTQLAVGADPQPPRDIGGQYQYYYHPDVLFNRTTKPVKESAAEFLAARLKGQKNAVTIVAAGPLTNIARLLKEHPESKPSIKKIVFVTGDAEENIATDVKSAQAVLASGVPMLIVPSDTTSGLTLNEAGRKRVFSPGTPLIHQVRTMYQLWDRETPILASPLAVALCFDERFARIEETVIEFDDKGMMLRKKGEPNVRLAVSAKSDMFLKWYVERMESLVPPHRKPAELIPRGAMPARVHVAEDYDLDIERRWWMSGKAETKDLPPGGIRACRGVLTHDFDDLLGNPKAMHTAVVFNPVPGPPMGANTRLGFRYKLKGTSTLRVQIYSLTNGYHRHLILKDLPQDKWESGTVDMTKCRRPDGTGGPLSEDERIDDIQFYVDSESEVIIDDVYLFEAAVPGEKRPFPARVHFTGLFDTGKQGKEWPGDFDIVEHQPPLKWKAAKSVKNADTGSPWLRIHLRGERPMGEKTHLRFRYSSTGTEPIRVALANGKTKAVYAIEWKDVKKGQWTETTLDFSDNKSEGKALRKGDRVDEIRFLLPPDAELLVDDVLLYEPG